MKQHLLILSMLLACTFHIASEQSTQQLLLTIDTYRVLGKHAQEHPTTDGHPSGHEEKHEDFDAEPERSEQYQQLQTLLNKLAFIPTLKENHFVVVLTERASATQGQISGAIGAANAASTLLKRSEPTVKLQIQIKASDTQVDSVDTPIADIVTMFTHSQPQNLAAQQAATQAIVSAMGNLAVTADGDITIPASPEGVTVTSGKISKESSEKIIDAIQKAQNLGVLTVTIASVSVGCQQLKDNIAAATYSAPPPPPIIRMDELQYAVDQNPAAGDGLIISQRILQAILCSAGVLSASLLGFVSLICNPSQYPPLVYNKANRTLLWQRFLTQCSTDLGSQRYNIDIPDSLEINMKNAQLVSINLVDENIIIKNNRDIHLGTVFDIQAIPSDYFTKYQKGSIAKDAYLSIINTILSIQFGDSLKNNKQLFIAAVKGFVKHYCKYYQSWNYYIRTKAPYYQSAQKLDTTTYGRRFLELMQQAKTLFGNMKMSLDRENKSDNNIASLNEGLTLQQLIDYINK